MNVRLVFSSPSQKLLPVLALLRFHARAGVRLAWRAAIPIFAAPTVAVGLSPDPSGTLNGFARGALAPNGRVAFILVLGLACLGVAAWGAPRLAYGVSAWLRHLPSGDDAQRRAMVAGLALTQLPVVSLVAVLWIFAVHNRLPVDRIRLVSVLVLVLGVAHLTLPCRNRFVAAIAGLMAISAALAVNRTLMGLALTTFVVADRWEGPLHVRRQVKTSGASRRRSRVVAVPLLITWRALKARWYLGYVPSGILLAITAFFVRNNDLSPKLSAMATGFGGGLALVASLAFVGKLIATRRPLWPWARSLPWSSLRRVAEDTAVLAVASFPLLVATTLIDLRAAAALSLLLPYMAARTAEAIRPPANDLTLIELLLVSGLVALIPLLALLYLLLVPAALAFAARRERRARSGHWDSMESLGLGDTQSWTGG